MIDIFHNADAKKFIFEKNGMEAVLAYQLHNNQIDFYSTYVPPQFRGQGIAEKLVRTGIAWANEQGYEMHASCWYAAKFL